MDEDANSIWRQASDATETAIAAARASGDWSHLDDIAKLLGIRDGPVGNGAWETICEALCSRR